MGLVITLKDVVEYVGKISCAIGRKDLHVTNERDLKRPRYPGTLPNLVILATLKIL